MKVLELNLTVAEGREVECARQLAAQLREGHWGILAKLAAELVFEHERRNAGARVIVVAGSEVADRVLADLSGTVQVAR